MCIKSVKRRIPVHQTEGANGGPDRSTPSETVLGYETVVMPASALSEVSFAGRCSVPIQKNGIWNTNWGIRSF